MIVIFAPKLYKVRKIDGSFIIGTKDRNLIIDKELNDKFLVNQQDNMIFRQCRILTESDDEYNKYIVFVDCKSIGSKHEEIENMVKYGFSINDQKFVFSERSASMTRNAILSFIDEKLAKQMDDIVSMGVPIHKTVLSKYLAYRGLMFSSCHCIEDWKPKIIVVPDSDKILKNQHIKYVIDEVKEYEKDGIKKQFVEKKIKSGYKDVPVTFNDGCGIIHPELAEYLSVYINAKSPITTMIFRGPFLKGVLHSIDYTSFYEETGIDFIQDIWGKWHDIHDKMIILTKSQYKGFKYFYKDGTYHDWERYWDLFEKYNHCLGIAKWNFSEDEEPVYTRLNYQVLQTNDLPFEQFIKLAQYSIDWIEKVIHKDYRATMIFLGILKSDVENNELNSPYMEAIRKNPKMINEECVNQYLKNLLRKYIDEFKCGKIWIKGCFKFLAPDLIMLLEHIGGVEEPQGSLESNQCWSRGKIDGKEYLIERNPHICASEDCILVNHTSDMIEKYCGHLTNVCMMNGKSLVMAQLNGCDYDGDLGLMIEDELLISGARHDLATTIDIDDKVTALEEEMNADGISKFVIRTLKSMIGEISNYATCYHNKNPKSVEQKQKYMEFIDLLSVLNGKAIDSAKTGVIYNVPPYIARYAKPLPYFMKYAGKYYSTMKEFNHSPSNMNRLALEIEKWEKKCVKYKIKKEPFDVGLVFNNDILENEEFKRILPLIDEVYNNFCNETKYYGVLQSKLDNWRNPDNKKFLKEEGIDISKAKDWVVNWNFVYNKYKNKCRTICDDRKILAYACVYVQYVKYKSKNKKFVWKVCPDGLIENIRVDEEVKLPYRDVNGEYEYLGKKYSFSVGSEEEFV